MSIETGGAGEKFPVRAPDVMRTADWVRWVVEARTQGAPIPAAVWARLRRRLGPPSAARRHRSSLRGALAAVEDAAEEVGERGAAVDQPVDGRALDHLPHDPRLEAADALAGLGVVDRLEEP